MEVRDRFDTASFLWRWWLYGGEGGKFVAGAAQSPAIAARRDMAGTLLKQQKANLRDRGPPEETAAWLMPSLSL